ncbi:fungal-specific transcription factor domain-containing protein [Copromyces sp. CBS 386.78]|nr:fungal-specific transcription factor domain-containing protein [Copromyces sp. CBS 386.78]
MRTVQGSACASPLPVTTAEIASHGSKCVIDSQLTPEIRKQCDGQHPSCGRCKELDMSCVYDEPPAHHRPRSSTTDTPSDILSRLSALEERINNASTSPTTGTKRSRQDANQDDEDDDNDDDDDDAQDNDRESNSTSNGLLAPPTLTGLPRSHQEDVNVDGMGEVQLTDDGENCAYFGPSSNVALVRQLSLALSRAQTQTSRSRAMPMTSVASLPSSSRYSALQQSRSESGQREPSNDGANVGGSRPQTGHHVPPEPEATNLIHEWFSTIGLFFPVIHQDTFMSTYHDLRKKGFMGARRVWLALLYMIIASVYRTDSPSTPSETSAETSERYFQWAKDLVLISSSLETVQLLCLMIEYLHGSSQSAQLWTLHSLAVKAALQIGLHSADASRHLTLLEREMRKRTWFLIVMNDNNLSAKFGRPMTIPPSLQKRLDPPQDISEYFPTIYASRSVTATSVDAFKCGVQLSHLTCQVVSQLYDDNAGGNSLNHVNTFDTLRLAFELSWKLSQWHQSVPPDLRPRSLTTDQFSPAALNQSSPPSPSIEAQRLRAVLSLRYYGLCTLVERPVLLKCLGLQLEPGHGEDTNSAAQVALLRDGYGVASLRRCIRACRECIALAKAIVDRWQNQKVLLSGAWWLTAYHAFGASLTLYTVLLIAAGGGGGGGGGGGTETKPPPTFSDLLSESELITVRSALGDAVDLLSRFGESLVISRCHDCLVNFLRAYDSVKVSSEQQQESYTTTTVQNNNPSNSSQSLPTSTDIPQRRMSRDGSGASGSGYGVGTTFPIDVDYYTGAPLAAALGDFTGVPLDFGHWGGPSPLHMTSVAVVQSFFLFLGSLSAYHSPEPRRLGSVFEVSNPSFQCLSHLALVPKSSILLRQYIVRLVYVPVDRNCVTQKSPRSRLRMYLSCNPDIAKIESPSPITLNGEHSNYRRPSSLMRVTDGRGRSRLMTKPS